MSLDYLFPWNWTFYMVGSKTFVKSPSQFWQYEDREQEGLNPYGMPTIWIQSEAELKTNKTNPYLPHLLSLSVFV